MKAHEKRPFRHYFYARLLDWTKYELRRWAHQLDKYRANESDFDLSVIQAKLKRYQNLEIYISQRMIRNAID